MVSARLIRTSRVLVNGFIFLLSIHCLLMTARAQGPEPADVLRIDTDLVNLNVSVFSRRPGQTPPSLAPKDFAVTDNGAPQDISFFAASDAPFDLVLLL